MIQELRKFFNFLSNNNNSETRTQQKETFIMDRMNNLAGLNLSDDKLTEKITSYLTYSQQGVANSLAFNSDLDKDIKNLTINIIKDNPLMYDFDHNNINVHDSKMDILKNEYINPKVAILIFNDDMDTAKTITFVDDMELDKLCRKEILNHNIKNFDKNQDNIVDTFIQLTESKDQAFELIFKQLSKEQTNKLDLSQSFDLNTQLDKELRKGNNSNQKIIDYCINHMDKSNTLETYIKNRVEKRSALDENAKQKLLLAQEQYYSTQENTIEQEESKKHCILSLQKDHETIFSKIENEDKSFYWVDKDDTVKIHPEKVLIPKVTRESVALALDAAVMNFGNELKIRGCPEFKKLILETIIDNDKYKDIKILNPELNQELEKMRGTPKNQMSQGVDSPENQIINPNLTPTNDNSVNNTANPVLTSPAPQEPVIDPVKLATLNPSTFSPANNYYMTGANSNYTPTNLASPPTVKINASIGNPVVNPIVNNNTNGTTNTIQGNHSPQQNTIIPDFTVTKSTTANDVLEHYAKIDAKVVEEARNKGWITYKQTGFTPSHVKIDAEPIDIAKQLEKITGVAVKIDSELTKNAQNQISR